MRCEVLIDKDMVSRGARMIEKMIKHAPIKCVPSITYRGDCDLLLTYGTGHPVRRPWWMKHRASGRHCIGLDLGYWQRKTPGAYDHMMRITIDDDHPHRLIQKEDPSRFDKSGVVLRNDYRENGPIILIGNSYKTAVAHGLHELQWERKAYSKLVERYPRARIIYRPKRITDPRLMGMQSQFGDIEDVLRGASLVVCRHSNVAVDACIAGIPVICDDGAAYALYKDNTHPTYEQRLEFLRSLAWWQFTPQEAKLAWNQILKRLPA